MSKESQIIKYCDAELILQAVHEQCDAHKAGIKAIQVHIDASSEVTGMQLKSVNDHLAALNHSVADLYQKHAERGEVVKEFYVVRDEVNKRGKRLEWAKKNWWVLTLLLMGFIVVIITIVDAIGLRGVFNVIKDVKDVL